MEDYRIDSHKLIYHPDIVTNWLNNKLIYPINAEVGISGACNHRCIFCSIDYLGYKANFLSATLCHQTFSEMHQKGLKSILLAGNGEPLINKDAVNIINDSKRLGIDMALSTNGVLLTEQVSHDCMKSLSWIRFSVSAGTDATYQKIHNAPKGDLNKVYANIEAAVNEKKKNNLNTVLGVQIVMIPENKDEIVSLGKEVKKLGVDQFSVKSFGILPLSQSKLKLTLNREEFYLYENELQKEIDSLSDDSFKAVYRKNRINKLSSEREYEECYASPFHVIIDGNGDVWQCCSMIGVKNMCFGNIKKHSFEEIWNSVERENALEILKKEKLIKCPKDCRLDDMNRYLYELKHPNAHVNFI